MSRSYRKNPVKKLSSKWHKRYANKVVRRSGLCAIASGKSYRRRYNSWNISDYRWEFFKPQDKKYFIERYGIIEYLKQWSK